MSTNPGIALGDFVAERTSLVAIVPQDAQEGAQIRAIHVLAGETISTDERNYWVLQLGVLATGKFRLIAAETPFQGGFTANVATTIPYLDPALVSRGTLVAIRMTPRGDPPPLVGLSVVVEWGILGSRRSARV